MLKPNNKEKKTSQINYSYTHYSHIRGVGINDIFSWKNLNQGFFSPFYIKKAAAIFLQFVKNLEFEKLNIIITGNFGTGKTSLCIGIALSLDKFIPFNVISAVQFDFSIISKIEFITQIVRKSIGIKFYEESFIIEGEVVEINLKKFKEKDNKLYAKLTLKNNQVQTVYKIGEEIYCKLLEKMIKKGDIVKIDKEKKIIEKKESVFPINNSESKKNEFGELKKELERYEISENIITMFELDILNSFSEFHLSKLLLENIKEISDEIREKIDRMVIRWEKSKKIKFIKGVLLFDEANKLDINCFSYLCKVLESLISPAFILSTNSSNFKVKGIDFSSPHGIPIDFIDRFLVIQTTPHSYNDLESILYLKAQKNLLFNTEAKELLIKIAMECGIRYSIFILSICTSEFQNKSVKIFTKYIKKLFFFFIDSKRFIRYTKKIKQNSLY